MNLNELIQSRLMTQESLCLAIGMEQAQLSRYATGRYRPRPNTIRRIAVGLGVTAEEVNEAVKETQRRKESALVN